MITDPPNLFCLFELLEPRPVQYLTIDTIILPVTPILKKGTENSYFESYTFWTSPGNVVTKDDILQLRIQLFSEDGEYPIASEEVNAYWETQTNQTRSQDTGFSIPSAWGAKR